MLCPQAKILMRPWSPEMPRSACSLMAKLTRRISIGEPLHAGLRIGSDRSASGRFAPVATR